MFSVTDDTCFGFLYGKHLTNRIYDDDDTVLYILNGKVFFSEDH